MLRFLTVVYLILLCFLSLNPWLKPSAAPALGLFTWDMFSHAAAYGLLSVLFLTSMTTLAFTKAASGFIAMMCSGLTGVLLEYGQSWFTATRQFSYHDIAANFLGGFVGVLCFSLFRFIYSYRKAKT